MVKQSDSTRDLKQRGVSVRVGMEAPGIHAVRAVTRELGIETWIGDAAKIKSSASGSRRPTAKMPDFC